MSDAPKLFELIYECRGEGHPPNEIHEFYAARDLDTVRAHHQKTATHHLTEFIDIVQVSSLDAYLIMLAEKSGTRTKDGRNITHNANITFLP